jgi:hypothetical protein
LLSSISGCHTAIAEVIECSHKQNIDRQEMSREIVTNNKHHLTIRCSLNQHDNIRAYNIFLQSSPAFTQ